jgi:hypothetical protein
MEHATVFGGILGNFGFRGSSTRQAARPRSTASRTILFEQMFAAITMLSLYLTVIAAAIFTITLIVLRPSLTAVGCLSVIGILLFTAYPALATAKDLGRALVDNHLTSGGHKRMPSELLRTVAVGSDIHSPQWWLEPVPDFQAKRAPGLSRCRRTHRLSGRWRAGKRWTAETASVRRSVLRPYNRGLARRTSDTHTNHKHSTHSITTKSTPRTIATSNSTMPPPVIPETANTLGQDDAAQQSSRNVAVMPRPGQPGAMYFDKTDVSEFLRRWNIECEDYGLTNRQKCTRIGDYCSKDVKEVIELLPGHSDSNWDTLQKELKNTYWQHDRQRDSTASLNQLVKDAPALDLNVYILKYSAISSTLVTKGALSPLDRVGRLLDGLPVDLRRRVLKFCAKNDWRLSAHDTGTVEPDFNELKKFVITEANTTQKETVYVNERASREGSTPTPASLAIDIKANVSTPERSTLIPTSTPAPAPAPDPIVELTKQFSNLALMIQASMQGKSSVAPQLAPLGSDRTSSNFQRQPFDPNRPLHCHWCDVTEHSRWRCGEFKDAMARKLVHINENGRIANTATGQELPVMFGRGGMKILFSAMATPSSTPSPSAPSVNAITFSDRHIASVGSGNTVHIITIQSDGTELHEIVDADVNEKRRRAPDGSARRLPETNPHTQPQPGQDLEELMNPHRTRQSTQLDTQTSPHAMTPPSQQPTQPVRTYPPAPIPQPVATGRDQATTPATAPASPTATATSEDTAMRDNNPRERRYRLGSELRESITIAEIGEKVMQMPISLTFGEVLAASPDLAAHFSEQARKRRRPLANTPITGTAEITTVDTSASVNLIKGAKAFYALPSGRAKTLVDDSLAVDALLDHGSELVIMPKRVFERLDLPIDPDVNWEINGYAKAKEQAPNDLLGVCHEVKLSVGGVEAIVPVFVVEDTDNDLILGRPWEREVRAHLINEDDGSVTVVIKSKDGRRIVRFCAVKADHERNRAFARQPERGSVGDEWGKA